MPTERARSRKEGEGEGERAREREASARPARRGRGAASIAWILIACATCAAPVQNGGVEVASGADDRLGLLCRWRRGDDARKDLCAPGEERVPPARVRRVLSAADRLGGPLAAGRVGDYLLENGEIAVVIDQIGRGAGLAEGGGNLIDAADARVRRDEIGQVVARFGDGRQAIYDELTSGLSADGTAWIQVTGHEAREPQLKVATRYSLGPVDRAVQMTTSLENRSPSPIGLLELGDVVAWGATQVLAPGKDPGFRGDAKGMYIASVGRQAAYLIAPVKDSDVWSKSGEGVSDVVIERDVALPPGGRAQYERVFAVATRADPVAVAMEFLYMQGGEPGGLAVKLVSAGGAAVTPPPGSRLLLERTAAAGAAPPVGTWWMSSEGAGERPLLFGGEVPPGRYTVRFEGGGRVSPRSTVVEIKSGATSTFALVVSDAGRLRVSVREVDAVASGAALEAPIADPAPPLAGLPAGDATSARATPAKITLLDAATGARVMPPFMVKDGELDVPVAPGRYRIIASRGPEFSLGQATVVVEAGATAAGSLRIARVVDTSGYIACDLHQHTSKSYDSGVSPAERAIQDVAEGVECAVMSEHNQVFDPAPILREIGLGRDLFAITGDEVTSDSSRRPFGHVSAFPLAVDAADPRGGAVSARDRTAKEVIDDLRALPGDRVIQINHPRSGGTGYFDLLKLDAASGLGAEPGYDARFDAVEVWSGRSAATRAQVIEDLWSLLRASRPATPTAGSDAHGTDGQEPGYPRTYVAVPSDDPARMDAGALVLALRARRDVVITNGPFVTIEALGVKQGGLVSARDGEKLRQRIELKVRVERAPWVDASEMVVVVGGVPGEPIPLTGARATRRGALINEITVPLLIGAAPASASVKGAASLKGAPAPARVSADSFVAVIVRGARPLEPVLSSDAARVIDIAPFAMTAPLWIDADGDGRSLGR